MPPFSLLSPWHRVHCLPPPTLACCCSPTPSHHHRHFHPLSVARARARLMIPCPRTRFTRDTHAPLHPPLSFRSPSAILSPPSLSSPFFRFALVVPQRVCVCGAPTSLSHPQTQERYTPRHRALSSPLLRSRSASLLFFSFSLPLG